MQHGGFNHNTKAMRRAKLAILINAALATVIPFVIYIARLAAAGDSIEFVYEAITFYIGVGVWLTKLIAAAYFIRWLLVASNNARVLVKNADIAPNREAVICWFVPIYNLVAPHMVLDQLCGSVTTVDSKRLNTLLARWVLFWTCQIPPVNWLILMIFASSVPAGFLTAADMVCTLGAAVTIFWLMDLVTLGQEKQFAEKQSETKSLPVSEPKEQESSVVIEVPESVPAEPS